MISCEYLFKEFNSQGSDEYLQAWAAQVDRMAEQGWEVFECVRRPQRFGLWTVLLCRPGQTLCRREKGPDLSGDCEA
jgi:hypothetical protein